MEKKTRLQKEHENFEKFVKMRMTESRIPKHAVSTVSESIAENHNCFKVKGYWVQLYIKKEDNNLYNLPDDEVLEDLEMTKESFLEEFPQFNVLVTKKQNAKIQKDGA